MRKSALVLGLVASLSAGAALAGSINPGVAQLAAQAGVNAANLSAADAASAWSFKHDNDAAAPYNANFVSGSLSSSNYGSVNAGVAQMAAQAGVNPANLSAVDVAADWAAKHDNDAAAPYNAAYASGSLSTSSTQTISAGRAQLAAQLRVDPAAYTSAELYNMKADLETE